MVLYTYTDYLYAFYDMTRICHMLCLEVNL
jgi:hypothetical protein